MSALYATFSITFWNCAPAHVDENYPLQSESPYWKLDKKATIADTCCCAHTWSIYVEDPIVH
jgi:hypothetical protein